MECIEGRLATWWRRAGANPPSGANEGTEMKLTTIWTTPSMSMRERLTRTGEAAWRTAAHRLPRRLAYWSLVDSGVRHMHSNEVIPEVPFTVVLERAGRGL